MVRRIELKDTEVRRMIAQKLGITSAALSMALSFKRNSPMAKTVREMALQHGGIYLEEKEVGRPVKVLDAKGNVVKTIK